MIKMERKKKYVALKDSYLKASGDKATTLRKKGTIYKLLKSDVDAFNESTKMGPLFALKESNPVIDTGIHDKPHIPKEAKVVETVILCGIDTGKPTKPELVEREPEVLKEAKPIVKRKRTPAKKK